MADNTKTYINITNKAIAFAEGALDPEIKSIVRKKAIWGGVFMAIPLYGIETIAYMFVLWSTYHKISDMSTVPFREHFFKNAIGGFITNIIVTGVLCLMLDFIPVAGWIASFAVGALSIYLSGMGYLKALKLMHGNKSKRDLDIESGFRAMNNNKPINSGTEQKAIENQ